MESPRSLPALTDDLLEEIFLRIGSPADLVRASTACVAFRGLIADPAFLRRYRSVHPPLLLGLLDEDGSFQPAEAPHPSAALSRAAAFSFDGYLPGGTGASWIIRDVRDGRVLLGSLCVPMEEERFYQLAVCDPLARRCLLLPPIPDDLLASAQVRKQDLLRFHTLLVPSGDDEDDTSFRVIAGMLRLVFIFSSATGQWGAATSASSDALSIPLDNSMVVWSFCYAYGCFYWKVKYKDKCLKLDMSSMEFSIVDLPPGCGPSYFIIVEAGEGRLGMFTLINDGASVCYTIWQIGGERPDQSKMDSTVIPLPMGYGFIIDGPYDGHILILGNQLTGLEGICFTLEIKTLKIEKVCQTRYFVVYPKYPYFGFPPSMSQRRI